MGVEFLHRPDDPEGIYWRKSKDITNPGEERQIASHYRKFHNEMLHNRGFSKDKSMRYVGSIPWDIWYGKIAESDNLNYWREDNYRKAKQWFNENNGMRVGDGFRK